MKKFTNNKILINILITIVIFCIVNAFPISVFSAFNTEINYQGKLMDSAGDPVTDGIYHMKFRLYNTLTGGTALWEGNRSFVAGNRISVTDGLFSAMLGSSTALTSVDFDQTLWLEVEIGGTASTTWEILSPRKKLGAVPAAFESDKLDGLDSLSFLRSDADDTFDSGNTLTLAGNLDSNGNVSFADTTLLFDGASTDFGITGDLTFNTNQFSLLKSSGNVGIGTTSPYAKLSINHQAGEIAFAIGSSTATSFIVDAFGNVGIGTANPAAALDVNGTATFTGDSSLIIQRNDGTDLAHFDRDGSNYRITFQGGNATSGFVVNDRNGLDLLRLDTSNNRRVAIGNFSASAKLEISAEGGSDDLLMLNASDGNDGDLFIVKNSGNVGIGTTSPISTLSVSGTTALDSTLITFASTTASKLTINYASVATSTIVDLKSYAWTIATSTNATPIFRINTAGTGGASGIATSTFMGGFGINSGAFLYDYGANKTSIERLDLGAISFDDDAGWISWVDLPVTSSAASGASQAYSAQIDSQQILTVYSQANGLGGIKNTRVIVGTSTDAVLGSSNIPYGSLLVADGALCVDNGGAADCDNTARSTGSIYALGTGSSYFAGKVGVGAVAPAGKFEVEVALEEGLTGLIIDQNDAVSNPIALEIQNAGTGNSFVVDTNEFIITGAGLVGIGTTTPTTLLSVSGTTTIGTLSTVTQAGINIGFGGLCVDNDGTCIASTTGRISSVSSTIGNSDVAEMYNSSQLLEDGEIVMAVRPTALGKFSIERAISKQGIIGVISTAPGIVLGLSPDGAKPDQYPVALSGRVPVKVSLENGFINVGDRITLSSTPGVGMKANYDDSSIGVALQKYDSYDTNGKFGTIVAFINLETFDNSGRFASILKWLEGIGLKIVDGIVSAKEFVAKKITTDELCIGNTCVNETQLRKLIENVNKNGSAGSNSTTNAGSATNNTGQKPDVTPPTITLLGQNPVKVLIGDDYIDGGVIVIDDRGDDGLDYRISVNGGDHIRNTDEIKINTSIVGENTVTFYVTDKSGNTSSKTRKVIVYKDENKSSEDTDEPAEGTGNSDESKPAEDPVNETDKTQEDETINEPEKDVSDDNIDSTKSQSELIEEIQTEPEQTDTQKTEEQTEYISPEQDSEPKSKPDPKQEVAVE